jgi:O-antigen/teichoic acid export membrane protein
LVFIVIFVELGYAIRGAIWGIILASVIELVVSSIYAKPPLISSAVLPLRRIMGFASPLFVTSISQRLFRMDLFALKALGGTATQAGFYGAALNLSIPPALFSKSLNPPLLSTLSYLIANGEEARAKEIGRTAMRSVLWLLPFATLIAAEATEIVRLVFGEKFLSSGPLLAFLIFATMGLLSRNISKSIITALGRPALTILYTVPMVPVALVGHLLLIPRLGAVGAAIVTASVSWMAAVASIFVLNHLWRIDLSLPSLFKSGLCIGIVLILANLWPASGLVLIMKLGTISFIILVSLMVLGEFSSKERAFIRSLVRAARGEEGERQETRGKRQWGNDEG